MTAGRIARSPWLLSAGTAGSSRKVSRWLRCRRKRLSNRLACGSFQGVAISASSRVCRRLRRVLYAVSTNSVCCFFKRRPSRIKRRSFLANFGQLLRGVLVLLDVFQVAQQVGQADLSPAAHHRVVGTPEIGHQRAVERPAEELRQHGPTPLSIDQVVRAAGVAEAPQPMPLAVHAPARLVAVQHRRVQGFVLNLLVPGKQDGLQAIPLTACNPPAVTFNCK